MILASKLVSIIVAFGVITFMVFAYVGSYLLNKKTPKPEGCESLEENCEGCNITSCHIRKELKEED